MSREQGYLACLGCSFTSKHSHVVKEHIESKHIKGPGYACPVCQRIVPTRKALKVHIYRSKHYSNEF